MNTNATTTTTTALADKAALVTGGSRGIGEAVALRLATDGADVAFTYRDNTELAAAVVDRIKALGRRALAVQADSADPAAVRAAVDQAAAEFGRLDIVVNNAAIGVLGPVEELSLADIDRVLAINVRAPFLTSQAALRHLVEGGRIITIGSCMAERVAFPGGSLYVTSKSALIGLTKALARELGPRGITANLVHPGSTDTDMNPAEGPSADLQRSFIPLGRFGQSSDVAATVAHLAGEAGRYITGATITLDGGYTA